MRKKVLSSVLAAGLVMGAVSVFTPSAFASTNQLKVIVGDKDYNLNQVLHNDYTYVQLRSLQDAFQADIDYDAPTQVVTVTRGDVVIKIDLKTNKVMLDGVALANIPAPYLDKKANRTMVPLRAFSQLFGQNVEWDGKTNTVTIAQSKQQTDLENKIKGILDAAEKAVASKPGMHMAMNMDMSMTGLSQPATSQQGSSLPVPDTSNMTMKGTFDGDAIVKPFAMHLKGTMTVSMGTMNQALNTEMYMQDGLVYMNDPMTHQWEKMQFMGQAEWQQLTNMMGTGTTEQDQQMQALMLPFMKLTDDSQNNAYVVTTYLNKTLLTKLQNSSPLVGTTSTNVSQTGAASDQMPNLGKMKISVTIDKTTNLEKDIHFDMSMSAPSGATGNMDMSMDMQLDFDHVNPVTIPDDVVKNAVDMSAMGGGVSGTSVSMPADPTQK